MIDRHKLSRVSEEKSKRPLTQLKSFQTSTVDVRAINDRLRERLNKSELKITPIKAVNESHNDY